MSEAMDVEPQPQDSTEDKKVEKEEPKPLTPAEIQNLFIEDLKTNLSMIAKSTKTKEDRYLLRVMRQTKSIRRKLTTSSLSQIIETTFPSNHSYKAELLQFVQSIKDNNSIEIENEQGNSSQTGNLLPEVEAYLRLLTLIFLIDNESYENAVTVANSLLEMLAKLNNRTMDPISSKAYFYFSRAYELSGRIADIRSTLIALHRTATLRHDDLGQATLINLILRNYLECNLYDQADKFVAKTTFPENATNSEFARYYFYIGRIKAVQLDYTEAENYLLQATRKAPQSGVLGFRLAVTKLSVIVQLLMGDIPEKRIFRQKDLQSALFPYLQLTQSVRIGDLASFHEVVDQHREEFKTDNTITLISRLRQNVIKTGLRKISVSYSRISFQDIWIKLKLDSPEDAEAIVAKAIHDGVIDATIDHEGGFIKSNDTVDVYATQEPARAFDKRIQFCLKVYTDSMKAMRYADDNDDHSGETLEDRIAREHEEEEYLADEFDDDDADDLF